MRNTRLLIGILYASYLTHAGVLLVIVPWSTMWRRAVLCYSAPWNAILDSPSLRGAVSAVGVLHLLALLAELAVAIRSVTESERPKLSG